MPLDPILNTPTVVTDADAKFPAPRKLTPDVTQDFISDAQLKAFIAQMVADGMDVSGVVEEPSNNHPDLQILSTDPRIVTLQGIVLVDGQPRGLNIIPGRYINKLRVERNNGIAGLDDSTFFGDHLRFYQCGPEWFQLVWSAE